MLGDGFTVLNGLSLVSLATDPLGSSHFSFLLSKLFVAFPYCRVKGTTWLPKCRRSCLTWFEALGGISAIHLIPVMWST